MTEPEVIHDIEVQTDVDGNPRLWIELEPGPGGTRRFRRMTQPEFENWRDSVTGNTNIRPAPDVEGTIPGN